MSKHFGPGRGGRALRRHPILIAAAVALPLTLAGCTETVSGSHVPATTTGAATQVQLMVDKALAQVGDRYVFGVEVSGSDPDPDVWDAAELTKWAAHQAGSEIPGSSFEQYLDIKAKGLLIPVDQAKKTPGALLFHFSSEPQPGGGRPADASVAISLGGGRMVEAQSEEVGVIAADAGSRFEYAGLVPGLAYPGL